jgi:hypothetical protein
MQSPEPLFECQRTGRPAYLGHRPSDVVTDSVQCVTSAASSFGVMPFFWRFPAKNKPHPFAEMLGEGLLIDVGRRSGSLMA